MTLVGFVGGYASGAQSTCQGVAVILSAIGATLGAAFVILNGLLNAEQDSCFYFACLSGVQTQRTNCCRGVSSMLLELSALCCTVAAGVVYQP